MSPQIALFDLDGTLVETAPEIADAVNDTLLQFGLPTVAQAQAEAWIGHGTHTLLMQALDWATAQAGHPAPALPPRTEISAAFDGHYHRRCGTRSRLYPGVREVLERLRANGVRLTVVTNKEGRYTQRVLDAHGLGPLFDRVVSGDSLASKKPDPAGVLHCLQAFGLGPAQALFVGDSSIDVATARRAGVAVWALSHGYNMGQPIAASQPDRVIHHFSTLLEAWPGVTA